MEDSFIGEGQYGKRNDNRKDLKKKVDAIRDGLR